MVRSRHRLKYKGVGTNSAIGLMRPMYEFQCSECLVDYYFGIETVREVMTGQPALWLGIPVKQLWWTGTCQGPVPPEVPD